MSQRKHSPSGKPSLRQINFRLPRPLCDRIVVAKGVLGLSQSDMAAAAFETYFATLDATRRRMIDDLLAMRRKG